ncbi:MAG: C10 family peptidase [Phycisphaerae bacterium]|nr:C10 family peptidase [Phycisphaerae bacterium]
MLNQKCILKRSRPIRVFFIAIILFFGVCVQAAPVDSFKAEKAVKGWLKTNRKPLGALLSVDIDSVETYTNQTGDIQYFVVNLDPEGYVIVSANDLLEPVIAFSSDGSYEPSDENPLFTLITGDTLARNKYLKEKGKHLEKGKKTKKQKKWNRFLVASDQTYQTYTDLSSVTDIRVPPLVQSRWNQGSVGGSPCYNYYTPPNQEPDGDSYNNYPCGCVATAMAQLMRYYEHPTTAIEYRLYDYLLEDVSGYSAYPKGGDGSGGAYDWANMPLVPTSGLTSTQRLQIGGICCDAGLSAEMNYAPGGSGASMYDASQALTGTFMYENSIIVYEFPYTVTNATQTINSNLDAQLPVAVSISATGSTVGHAVLADGYGYDGETMYHHINMGWGGSADAWYNIPDIYTYDEIDGIIFNIYPSGTGEIISGRITNDSGMPVEGVTVEALQGTTVIQTAVTSQYGVYGLSRLPSEQTYTIRPAKEAYLFTSQDVTVGLSDMWAPAGEGCGNVCDADFVGIELAGTPPTAYDQEVILTDANGLMIELIATDDGSPASPGKLSYIITSLPAHGWLFDPNDGLEILTAPHTLQNDSNSVIYRPCPYYFAGTDTFSFKANDGGVAPEGGDSNIANVNVVMNMLSDTVFEVHTIYKDYIPFMTGFKKVRSQALYHADELGSKSQVIANLALNIETAPAIEIQNWTIRMKHTTLSEYPTSGAQFDNDGWTVVYDANETITQTGWHDFALEQTFDYDGTSNLMIDFSFDNTATSTGYGYVYDSTPGTEYRIISYWSNSGDPLAFQTPNVKWKRLFNVTLKGQPDTEILYSDFNYNCSVGSEDLLTMIDTWLAQEGDANYNSDCDISVQVDKKVNLADFAVLASEWLLAIE